MKTKNRILLFTLIVPFIMVVVVIVSIRKSFNEATAPSRHYSEGTESFTTSFDFDDFENISAEGFWNISITHGDRYGIELVAPEKMLDEITVEKTERTLILSMEKNTFTLFSIGKIPEINIKLPSIPKLNIKGVANILIAGFNNSEAFISTDGVINISAKECTFDRFSLSGSGVMNASVDTVPVTDAHFDYRGIYNVTLLMNGGSLTGYLDGIGRMTVSGEISKNSILVKEFGQLKVIK